MLVDHMSAVASSGAARHPETWRLEIDTDGPNLIAAQPGMSAGLAPRSICATTFRGTLKECGHLARPRRSCCLARRTFEPKSGHESPKYFGE